MLKYSFFNFLALMTASQFNKIFLTYSYLLRLKITDVTDYNWNLLNTFNQTRLKILQPMVKILNKPVKKQ